MDTCTPGRARDRSALNGDASATGFDGGARSDSVQLNTHPLEKHGLAGSNDAETMHLFEVTDFNQRWLNARISVFGEIDPQDRHLEANDAACDPAHESNLIEIFFSRLDSDNPIDREKRKDRLQRGIFDNSRKLAKSLSRHLGLTFEVHDFKAFLSQSNIPCAQGLWSSRPHARILKRKGCDSCVQAGHNACDYWREALDGLVVGLGDTERLARHASVRHGDSECVDVFYTERIHNEDSALAWGPLPEHMALDLLEMASLFQHQTGVDVDLKGFREGVLFFEFRSSTDQLCGNAGLLSSRLFGIIKEKYPGLSIRDVTPQAVFGTPGGDT